MNDWDLAKDIATKALEYGKPLVKKGALVLDICEKIESKIEELGGKPAFPVNVSINRVAAHYTALPNDSLALEEGDLVKVDVGAHINGAIGDVAGTVDLGDHKELVQAAEDALKNIKEMIKPGIELREIGKKIQEIIQGYGFSPIKNLSGHELDLYTIHAGMTIPNYDNGDTTKLEKGQHIAIEPFATTGEGKVVEGGESGIYRLHNLKPVRDVGARKVIKFIQEEYKGLPFAKRWVVKKFPNANYILRLLEKEKILKHYPQLVEISKGLVSQAETSFTV